MPDPIPRYVVCFCGVVVGIPATSIDLPDPIPRYVVCFLGAAVFGGSKRSVDFVAEEIFPALTLVRSFVTGIPSAVLFASLAFNFKSNFCLTLSFAATDAGEDTGFCFVPGRGIDNFCGANFGALTFATCF